jgi:Pentapeptide repeats (9 copies)
MSPAAIGSAVPECVDMEDDASDYSQAERRLVDAITAGAVCDFADGAEITAEEMASWGPERTIRATVLLQLLTAGDARYATDGIHLRGAAVVGGLDLTGLNVMPLDLQRCQIATIQASGATFTGNASFTGANFTGFAWFEGAKFTGDAWFDGATFTDDASFTGDAWFKDATFTCNAWFAGATFTSNAEFDGATFTSDTGFGDATFTGNAGFTRATFTGYAGFAGATFTSDASFAGATFTSFAWFAGATFTSNASFAGATFTRVARFDGATFTSNASFAGASFTATAWFDDAIANAYDFSRAQFHTADPGPWVARRVTLTGAVFHVRARVAVAAAETCCDRLQAREGVHLLVRDSAVDLEDAELLRRSILAHSESEPALPGRQSPGELPEGFDKLTPAEQARWTAKDQAFQFAQRLADELGSQKTARTQVASLRRATAGDLVLSGVGLEDCAFVGAHGLDKLRIGATCSFQRPPAWPSRTWRLFTGRQVISEEGQWRQTHTRGWASTSTTPTASAKPNDPVPTALEIAGIYRDLRKGLEDAKDEPGAADFYYGEMEMRRLAARRHRHRDDGDGEAEGRRPSWTERRLLDVYWAVSGYGLRAWRALTALAILLIGCAALLTLPTFAHLPAPPQQVTSVNLATGALRYAPITQPA